RPFGTETVEIWNLGWHLPAGDRAGPGAFCQIAAPLADEERVRSAVRYVRDAHLAVAVEHPTVANVPVRIAQQVTRIHRDLRVAEDADVIAVRDRDRIAIYVEKGR